MIAILIEKKADETVAREINKELDAFGINSEIYLLSALKVPELVIDLVSDFNRSGKEVVHMVISQSPALAGMVSASSFHPVISLNTSNEIVSYPAFAPAMIVQNSKNAILAAIKILALENSKLKKRITQQIDEMKESY